MASTGKITTPPEQPASKERAKATDSLVTVSLSDRRSNESSQLDGFSDDDAGAISETTVGMGDFESMRSARDSAGSVSAVEGEIAKVQTEVTDKEASPETAAEPTPAPPAEPKPSGLEPSIEIKAKAEPTLDPASSDSKDEEAATPKPVLKPGDEPSPEIENLVSRLEEENERIAADPKSHITGQTLTVPMSPPRPRSPSLRQIGRLVHDQLPSNIRVSKLPEAPLTELEFWSGLVRDFPTISQRLPSLTTHKLRNGVPDPLRGHVWRSMAGVAVGSPQAADLEKEWNRLKDQRSPSSNEITKDVGRCYPLVEMFRNSQGSGQEMLRRVLNAYSLYDPEIGYCQGLGFVAGVLLMQMPECEAFTVLVCLLRDHQLKSFYKQDLEGLHLAIFQFENLLETHIPDLSDHFKEVKVDGSFLTRWLLCLFGASCPLKVLFRVYDVLFFEGAKSVLLRVALSLVKRNEEILKAASDYEKVMKLLLSPSLWDIYRVGETDEEMAAELMRDVSEWATVTKVELLEGLEVEFASLPPKEKPIVDVAAVPERPQGPSFLARLWSGPSLKDDSASGSRTSSIVPTAGDRDKEKEKEELPSPTAASLLSRGDKVERSLHSQIEDLLIALRDLQNEHHATMESLKAEREGRARELGCMAALVRSVQAHTDAGGVPGKITTEDGGLQIHSTLPPMSATHSRSKSVKTGSEVLSLPIAMRKAVHVLENSEADSEPPSVKLMRTALSEAAGRATNASDALMMRDSQILRLTEQMADQATELTATKDELAEVKKELEQLKAQGGQKGVLGQLPAGQVNSISGANRQLGGVKGMLGGGRLDEVTPPRSPPVPGPKGEADQREADFEAVLTELARAKTSEASALHELEEVRDKYERLCKRVPSAVQSAAASIRSRASSAVDKENVVNAGESGGFGGFFSGWRRGTST